jgi:hypothetical protein
MSCASNRGSSSLVVSGHWGVLSDWVILHTCVMINILFLGTHGGKVLRHNLGASVTICRRTSQQKDRLFFVVDPGYSSSAYVLMDPNSMPQLLNM